MPIHVSIPDAYTTPGAYLQGNLTLHTVGGIAVFRRDTSIRIDKVPPNPKIGYKLQFDALLYDEFPDIGTGNSDFFRISAGAAVTIGFARQIAQDDDFFVFSPVGGDAGAALVESRDKFGNLAVDTDDSVFAALYTTGHPLATLQGTTAIELVDGYANFDNLLIDQNGADYTIKFCLKSPFSCPESIISNSFSISPLNGILITIQPSDYYAGSANPPNITNPELYEGSGAKERPLGPSVQILDETGKPLSTKVYVIAGILGDSTKTLLKGSTRTASAFGLAQFEDISIHRTGVYQILFSVGIPGSTLAALSNTFTIFPSKESEQCLNPRDCRLNILRQPHPFWCDGLDRNPDDFILPTDVVVGNCFRTLLNVTDAYGNILRFGNVTVEPFLDGLALPTDPLDGSVSWMDWRQHLINQRTFRSISEARDGVLVFIMKIERSCSKVDCAGESDKGRKGYVLQFNKEHTILSTHVFEILPDKATSFTFKLENWDGEKEIDEVYAGAQITPGPAWVDGIGGPTYYLYDKFGNLATTQEGVFVWNVTYTGPGCMLCDKQIVTREGIQGDACQFKGRGVGRTNELQITQSTCTDLVEPKDGKLQINVSAPTLVVRDYAYEFRVELKSWNFVEDDMFRGSVMRKFDLLAGIPADVSYARTDLLNRVAGQVFQAAVAVTDMFGNTVITG